MAIQLGNTEASLYLGSTPVAAYLGAVQVYSAANPFATLVSTKSTGNISGDAQSDTGYIKVEWWDSTEDVYGTGVAGDIIVWSKAAGGAGEKTLRIYPSDASGNLSGALTVLDCNNNSLTSLDVSGLTSLTVLYCNNNSLTSLDVSGLTSLTVLYCNNNSLTSLRAVGFVGVADYTSPFTPSSSGYDATVIGNNNLSASALNQFYADLADITPSYALLFVGQNPGIESHDPAIATAKGWLVINLPPPL
jgi:hypothetical protein